MDAWNQRAPRCVGIDRSRSQLPHRPGRRRTHHARLRQSPALGSSVLHRLCGNSIWQDRRFLARYMPTLEAYLHYRIVDVSSIKELARRWYPDPTAVPEKEEHPPRSRRRPRVDCGAARLPPPDLPLNHAALGRIVRKIGQLGRGQPCRPGIGTGKLAPRRSPWQRDGMNAAAPESPPTHPIDRPVRLAVLLSGGGTTLQNLLDEIARGPALDAEIVSRGRFARFRGPASRDSSAPPTPGSPTAAPCRAKRTPNSVLVQRRPACQKLDAV